MNMHRHVDVHNPSISAQLVFSPVYLMRLRAFSKQIPLIFQWVEHLCFDVVVSSTQDIPPTMHWEYSRKNTAWERQPVQSQVNYRNSQTSQDNQSPSLDLIRNMNWLINTQLRKTSGLSGWAFVSISNNYCSHLFCEFSLWRRFWRSVVRPTRVCVCVCVWKLLQMVWLTHKNAYTQAKYHNHCYVCTG